MPLYPAPMKNEDDSWERWGERLRKHLADHESSLAKLAELVDRAESTLRSWTNGTRAINLSDFIRLCEAAEADPATILFGRPTLSEQELLDLRAARQMLTKILPPNGHG